MVVLLVLLTVVAFLTVDYFVQRAAMRRAAVAGGTQATPTLAAPAGVPTGARAVSWSDQIPPGVFVGREHAWLQVEPDGDVVVGADRLPVGLLGGVDFVDFQRAGTGVSRGQPIAVLHRGFREVPIRAPLSGRIVRTHVDAEIDPSRIAADPYGGGWLVKIRPADLGTALKRMLIGGEAIDWMRRELCRVRDTLTTWSRSGGLAPRLVTLPDGGLPADGLAESLSAPKWEELCERLFPETHDEKTDETAPAGDAASRR